MVIEQLEQCLENINKQENKCYSLYSLSSWILDSSFKIEERIYKQDIKRSPGKKKQGRGNDKKFPLVAHEDNELVRYSELGA